VQGQQRGHPAGNEATQTLELAAGGGKPVDSGGNRGSGGVVRLDDIPAVVGRQCVVERRRKGMTDERWQKAIENARFMLEVYKETPMGMFGALAISQDIQLYEAGDRSEALLESLEGIE